MRSKKTSIFLCLLILTTVFTAVALPAIGNAITHEGTEVSTSKKVVEENEGESSSTVLHLVKDPFQIDGTAYAFVTIVPKENIDRETNGNIESAESIPIVFILLILGMVLNIGLIHLKLKKKKYKFSRALSFGLMVILIITIFTVAMPTNVTAEGVEEEPQFPEAPDEPLYEEESTIPEEPFFPEAPSGLWNEDRKNMVIDANGTYFEITNSSYLNITMTSSEDVYVHLESIPKTVSFIIESNCSATSTLITLSGFEADKKYYRYQDGNLQEDFVTDEDGLYSYIQDISTNHHVFIQEVKSTIYILSDGTVDPPDAPISQVGSTYTLTSNIYESIYVEKSGITLNGGGHTISGSGSLAYGVYLNGISNTTIKNFKIKECVGGIYIYNSSNNTLIDNDCDLNWQDIGLYSSSNYNSVQNNTCTNRGVGILLYDSMYNTISGNTCSNGDEGIYLAYSDWNTITNNTCLSNLNGFVLESSSDNNTVDGNTSNQNKEIAVVIANNSNDNTLSNNTINSNLRNGIFIVPNGGENNIISSNIIQENDEIDPQLYPAIMIRTNSNQVIDNTITNNAGGSIYLGSASGNIISNNDCSYSYLGIYVDWLSNNNSIQGNTASNTELRGIQLSYSYTNNVSNNEISNNAENGLYLLNSFENNISDNTVSGNGIHGILLVNCSNVNNIINNEVTNNTQNGIFLYSSYENTITGNTVSENQINGIHLAYYSNGNYLTNNEVLNNTHNGIYLNNSHWNSISGNKIDRNSRNGLFLDNCNNVTINDNPSISWNGKGGSGYLDRSGILLKNCIHVDISTNPHIDNNNFIGIYITYNSNDIDVANNGIYNNGDDGINCEHNPSEGDNPYLPNNVNIIGNTVSNSKDEGIHIYSGTDILIQGNNIQDGNMTGITIDSNGGQNIRILNNNISGNGTFGPHWYAGILLCPEFSVLVKGNIIYHNHREGIYIHSDTNVHDNYHIIEQNEIYENSWEGICIKSYPSNYNTIKGNIVRDNGKDGIYLVDSIGNVIINNTILNNNCGIRLEYSDNNTFYHNEIIDNVIQVYSISSSNTWDNGTEGNYWSDYTGSDLNGDGIGDTEIPHPHIDQGNGYYHLDNYPLYREQDPPTLIETLIEKIEAMDLEAGIENSLISKLDNSLKSLEKGNNGVAINQLNAFINEVEAQRGKKLTNEQADMLIAAAGEILATINEGGT